MKQAQSDDYVLGVAGAGAMGLGTAQVAAEGGIRALIFDASQEAAATGLVKISGRLNRLAEKGEVTAFNAAAAISLLSTADRHEEIVSAHWSLA